MIVNKYTSLSEFVLYIDVLGIESEKLEGFFERLKSYTLPDIFYKSFNELTFRQLVELQRKIKTFDDLIFISFEVVHDLKREDIIKLSAFDCLRFALYTKEELERITKLFKDIEYKPTPEEEKAGIKNITNDFFDTADWYARRMGIQNQDEVFNLAWVRIYRCLRKEFENSQFEKRYRQIVNQQNKMK